MTPKKALHDVTAVVKTFERPHCLNRLLTSLRRFYPQMPVIVCDDGFVPSYRSDVAYIRTEPDIGLSAGRNRLVEEVDTPYFLLLDDDLVFTEASKIERLATIVKTHDVSLAAGDYITCKQKFFRERKKREEFCGTFERTNGHLALHRGYHKKINDFYLCDMVVNFFVADVEAVRSMGGWDTELKVDEHVDFFLRLLDRGLRAAYCPDVIVEHWHLRSRKYKRFRRRQQFFPMSLKKHGVTKYTAMDGRVVLVS